MVALIVWLRNPTKTLLGDMVLIAKPVVHFNQTKAKPRVSTLLRLLSCFNM